uniref:NADH dehydrogenase subunit 4 n=1 Tax=Centrotypus laticornis TaxID=2980484 RepID=UPI0028FC8B56|nr:NADH dehydrogenase subunit 4 [Centrotypus laticornis]UXF57639.1 NADH dehydrogenase subunit 4 [Centrotypus laticornis]
MMSFIFFLVFMIPMFFFDFFYLYQFIYMFFIFFFVFSNINFSFSCISYLFGIDFLSYILIILSFYIVSLMSLSSLNFNNSLFFFLNYLIVFLLFLIFCSFNMLVMYISFEFILIPLMVLIFGWGYQPERLVSGLYLFFFTLFGSLPLFVFIVYVYLDFYTLTFIFELNLSNNFYVNFIIVIPFLISFPMFMVHFWLPSAHVQAPVSGSMILAGLMLSIGGYGLIRFMNLNDLIFFNYSYIWFSMGLLGSFLVGLVCLIQVDMKSLIAYSSISHMSLCLMGILTMSSFGMLGAFVMMVSHGLCSSGLFCLANICYLRVLSRSMYMVKGMIFFMPSLSFFWFIFCVFNMGCPPSINFLGELFIIMSSICYYDYSFIFLFFSSFISACFSFYLYTFSQHGSFLSFYSCCNVHVSEYLLLFSHLFPLVTLLFFFMIF